MVKDFITNVLPSFKTSIVYKNVKEINATSITQMDKNTQDKAKRKLRFTTSILTALLFELNIIDKEMDILLL